VVQISSDLSERKFLGTSSRPLSVSLPIAIKPKPGACGQISATTTRQKLAVKPLIFMVGVLGFQARGQRPRPGMTAFLRFLHPATRDRSPPVHCTLLSRRELNLGSSKLIRPAP
jgi:hypothetical protein